MDTFIRPLGLSPSVPTDARLCIGLPGTWVDLSLPMCPDVVDALADLCSSAPSSPDAGRRELQVVPDGTHFNLCSDGHGIRAGIAGEDLVDAIVALLNQWVLETDAARLHLHAACVDRDGLGIVLAGPSGSGKTTVTTALLDLGASYLTDECLTVLPGSRTVYAYPKPLTIKTGPGAAVPSAPLPAPASTGRVALRATTFATVVSHTSVDVVAFPTFAPGTKASLRAVPPAEAALRLLGDCLDGVRLGAGALDVVAALVGRATCVEVVYGNPAEAAALLASVRPPASSTWVSSFEVRGPDEAPDGSFRGAIFANSALMLDDHGRMIQLHHDEVEAILQLPSGSRGLSAPPGLCRLEDAGFTFASSRLTTRAAARWKAGSQRAATGEAAEVEVLVRLWDELAEVGLAPLLAGQSVIRLEASAPRSMWDLPGVPLVLVEHRHLAAAASICRGTDVLIGSSISPSPFSTHLGYERLAKESTPTRLGGRWIESVSPYHRFVHACFVAACAPAPTLSEADAIVAAAPQVRPSARDAICRADNEGYLHIVHWATVRAQAATGQVAAELLPQPRHLPTRLRRHLAAVWYRRQHEGDIGEYPHSIEAAGSVLTRHGRDA